MSKAERRTPINRPGTSARMPLDDRPHEPHPVLERSAVPPLARPCPQQLVPEVAVAGLDVDELIPGVASQPGRRHEVQDERVELVVGKDRDAGGTRRSRSGCATAAIGSARS